MLELIKIKLKYPYFGLQSLLSPSFGLQSHDFFSILGNKASNAISTSVKTITKPIKLTINDKIITTSAIRIHEVV